MPTREKENSEIMFPGEAEGVPLPLQIAVLGVLTRPYSRPWEGNCALDGGGIAEGSGRN